MILEVNAKEAVRSLFSAKQRSVLALIGIIIGIGSVIALVSIGTIVKENSLKQFTGMGVDIIALRKGYDRNSRLKLNDIIDFGNKSKTVREVTPRVSSSFTLYNEKKSLHINAFGSTSNFFSINKLSISEGRELSDLDEESFYCVIGIDLASYLRSKGNGKVIGSHINLGDRLYTVIGVLDKVQDGGGMRPFGLNRSVIVHITTALRYFKNSEITEITGRVRKGASPDQAKAEVNSFFDKRYRNLQLQFISAEELIERMAEQLRSFTILLGTIGGISLIVGGVGVMNVMLVSVSERRKEIGIRRALGAKRKDIQLQFITESLLLCIIGGILGVLLGVIATYVIAKYSSWEFLVAYDAIILGLVVSTFTGIFFGFYPAYQASRLNPITALRGE